MDENVKYINIPGKEDGYNDALQILKDGFGFSESEIISYEKQFVGKDCYNHRFGMPNVIKNEKIISVPGDGQSALLHLKNVWKIKEDCIISRITTMEKLFERDVYMTTFTIRADKESL